MHNITNDPLYNEVNATHFACGPYVKTISEGFAFPRPLHDLLWRSGLRKGHDTLGTILHLIAENQAGMALPLLRPMCENLLYLLYLAQLPEATADKVILLGGRREVLESLLAQSGGDGSAAWTDIGISGRRPAEEELAKCKVELVKEGQMLGWRKGSYWPSVSHVAAKTGMTILYDEIYHGTSRGVHFSPHHLMRMIWGPPEGVYTATLDNFARYYEAYALTNAGWIFCTLIAHCWTVADVEPEQVLNAQVIQLIEKLSDFGKVPIVTADEIGASNFSNG